jgi:branched-chain amino acid transport system permease protein
MQQFIANGLCKGAVYALVSLGFGLIYTTTGVFHIAHGAVYALAAYLLICGFTVLKLPLLLSILLSCVLTVIFGVLLEVTLYAPLRDRRSSSSVLMISSLGAYIVIINLLAVLFGNETKFLLEGVARTVTVGGAILTRLQVAQLAVALFLVTLYWLFLHKTALGRICRCVADDPVLSSVLGVRVDHARFAVFGLGSFLAAAGAILMALDIGVDPQVGFPIVLLAAVACVVGGLHRFVAPAMGGLLLGIIQGLVAWKVSAKWESAVTFAILLAFLLVRPQGLFGARQRIEE